jgi:ribosomal protein S18 acetylase RimI-like enzyme
MSGQLSPKPFVEQSISEVQDFDCGSTVWARPLNDWIKNGDATKRLRKGDTKIWLYYAELDLIGYGSLGVTSWPVIFPERQRIIHLPNLAVQEKHQRKGYGKMICKHLIEEAQALYRQLKANNKPIVPIVSLLVHPENADAKGLYKSLGFANFDYFYRDPDDGVRYEGMARLLDFA